MALQLSPTISVKGRLFDCGRQHGAQSKERIRKNINAYFDLWSALWGAKRPEIPEQCRRFVPVIGEYDADILEERALYIAEGAPYQNEHHKLSPRILWQD